MPFFPYPPTSLTGKQSPGGGKYAGNVEWKGEGVWEVGRHQGVGLVFFLSFCSAQITFQRFTPNGKQLQPHRLAGQLWLLFLGLGYLPRMGNAGVKGLCKVRGLTE